MQSYLFSCLKGRCMLISSWSLFDNLQKKYHICICWIYFAHLNKDWYNSKTAFQSKVNLDEKLVPTKENCLWQHMLKCNFILPWFSVRLYLTSSFLSAIVTRAFGRLCAVNNVTGRSSCICIKFHCATWE